MAAKKKAKKKIAKKKVQVAMMSIEDQIALMRKNKNRPPVKGAKAVLGRKLRKKKNG